MYRNLIVTLKVLALLLYAGSIFLTEDKMFYLLVFGIFYWVVLFFIEAGVEFDPELPYNLETFDRLRARRRFIIFNFISFTLLTCVALPTNLSPYCVAVGVSLVFLSGVTKLDRIIDL